VLSEKRKAAMRAYSKARFDTLTPQQRNELRRHLRDRATERRAELAHRARGHRKGQSTRGILGETVEGISIITEAELIEPWYIIISKDGRRESELWLKAGAIAKRGEKQRPDRLARALEFDARCHDLAMQLAAEGAAIDEDPPGTAQAQQAPIKTRCPKELDTNAEKE
jgi:hypothetical protein